MALVQSDWRRRKRKRRHRATPGVRVQRDHRGRAQGEGDHLHARREAPGDTSPAHASTSDLQPPACKTIDSCSSSRPGLGLRESGPQPQQTPTGSGRGNPGASVPRGGCDRSRALRPGPLGSSQMRAGHVLPSSRFEFLSDNTWADKYLK